MWNSGNKSIYSIIIIYIIDFFDLSIVIQGKESFEIYCTKRLTQFVLSVVPNIPVVLEQA
jgi:hypothetical protein